MQPGVMEARPPYIRFKMMAFEKRDAAGGVHFVDKEIACVTPMGSKDTTEKIVDEWFPHLKKEIHEGRFPQAWFNAYQEAYKAWKEDREPPLNGTHILNWPAASPAEIAILSALGIRAVEDLAQANEEVMAKIGMGARDLVQRAKDYVQARDDHAPLIAALSALRSANAVLEVRNQSLEGQIATLTAQLSGSRQYVSMAASAGIPPVSDDLEARLAEAQAAATPRGPSESKLVDSAIEEALDGIGE